MLVLSRKCHEKVVITVGSERVEITVAELRGDKCRLAFDAPQSIRIDRAEVDQKRRDNPRAA